MKQIQRHYNEFQKRFKAMSDKELIDAFNRDVGNPGWVSARGEYHGALRAEFENRGYDYLSIGDKGVSIKKMGKVKPYFRVKKWVEQDKIQRVLPWINLVLAVIIVGFLILLSTNDAALNFVLGLYTKSVPQSLAPEIEVPTSAPVYAVPTVAQPVYKAPTPIPDPDPFVTCNISSNCGGGSVRLRKNACSQTTCCQIGPQWLFYNSKDKCVQDQNALTALHNTKPPQIPTQTGSSAQPLVTCTLSYGTYQLTQSSCDSFKSSDKPYIPSSNTQAVVTPDPVIQQQNNNSELNQECKTDAALTFNNQKQQCINLYGMQSSTGPACIQISQGYYDQAVITCNSQYPI